MSSSVHADNKHILILGKGQTKGLDNTWLSRISYYFCKIRKKLLFSSLHYNGSNSYLFVNGTKIHQFKAKDSEIKRYPLCLGNISKDFSVDNMKKTRLNGYDYDFGVDYNVIDTRNIIDIHKYLMKKHDRK